MPLHPFITNRWLDQLNEFNLDNKWILNKNKDDEITSFAYMPTKNIKSIFLGTFPIFEIAEGLNNHNHKEFFYGSNQNSFWPMLNELLDMNITDVADCINILDDNNVGISDILLEIHREGNGNEDMNLQAIKYNDILEIHQQFPLLENIFLTSGGKGPVSNINNAKSAASWLKDYSNQFIPNPTGFNANGLKKDITIQGQPLRLIILYSPSNNNNTAMKAILRRNNYFNIQNLSVLDFKKLQWAYLLRSYLFTENAPEALENNYQLITQNQALVDFFEN